MFGKDDVDNVEFFNEIKDICNNQNNRDIVQETKRYMENHLLLKQTALQYAVLFFF